MQISIETVEGKTINLEVDDSSDTMDLKIHGPTRELILRFGTDPDSEAEALLKIFVSTLGGKVWVLKVKGTESIQTVMAKIHELGGTPVADQNLIYEGVKLRRDRTMNDYGIKNGSTLVMMSSQCGC